MTSCYISLHGMPDSSEGVDQHVCGINELQHCIGVLICCSTCAYEASDERCLRLQSHGILKGPEEWEPQITVAVNATSSHNLTYIFPGGSKGRPHAPLLLAANMTDAMPLNGGWQVRTPT